MVFITDVAFKLNKLESFIYNFTHDGYKVTEYIHGIVLEFVETHPDGSPEKVKIKQVSNLEDYLNKKDTVTFTERIFRVNQLQPLTFIKS